MPISQEPKTFDPSQVIFVVGGIPIGGFKDGVGIKVERSEDSFIDVTGMDGVTSRAASVDRSGTITCVLAQTSPSNAVLSALANLDETTKKGIVPVSITDLSGTSEYLSANAWIKKHAGAEFGKEISDREWVFRCVNLRMFTGGNVLGQ